MFWDIKKMTYLEKYTLKLVFKDDESGIVDLSGYKKRGGVFSRFTDIEYFKQVKLENGYLVWPGDVDIAPETIYSMATGKPIEEIMAPDEKTV